MYRSILIIAILMLAACAPAPTSALTTASAAPTSAAVQPAAPTNAGSLAPNSTAAGVHQGVVLVDDSFVTVYGEYENTGQRWLHNILIVVTYFDAAGSEIYIDKVPTEILFAGPGERVPFFVVTDKARMQGAYASHSITVQSIENDQPGYQLAVDFSDLGISYGVGEVTGTVRHTENGTCGYPTVAVAYYDAYDRVLAVSSNYVENLAPGQEASFKLLTPMLNMEYIWIEAWAACREIDGTPVP